MAMCFFYRFVDTSLGRDMVGNALNFNPTQYDPIVGSTNGQITSVDVGTAGQVFTSNGPGMDPSFQTPSSPFNPSTNVILQDDFINGLTDSSIGLVDFFGELCWLNQNGSILGFTISNATEAGHPGILGSTASSSAINLLALASANGTVYRPIILGGGELSVNWVIKTAILADNTNRYVFRCGLGDTFAGGFDQVNGVYFEYSNTINSGNWVGKTASASSRTTANSSTAVTTSWVNLGITVNAAATSVSFYVNGVEIANSPITATIPTTSLCPFLIVDQATGTIAADSVIIDLFYLNQTLTTSR